MNLVFLVPSPHLGRTEDVQPERLTLRENAWIRVTREELKKKRKLAEGGRYAPPVDLTGEKQPFGAEHCPGMAELTSIGFLLKWPATAILKNVSKAGWMLKPSTNFNFYDYHPQTSFAELGEAEVVSVDVGWMVVTPPGWSVMLKNVPNNLGGVNPGLSIAEGVVRTDRATIPLKTHAFLDARAGKEIRLKRGEPMAILHPFKREPVDIAIVDDREVIEEAARLAAENEKAFREKPGVYQKLYVDGDGGPTPLYAKLMDAWKAKAT